LHSEDEETEDISSQQPNEQIFDNFINTISISAPEMASAREAAMPREQSTFELLTSQSTPQLEITIPDRIIPSRLTQSSISLHTPLPPLPQSISTNIRRDSVTRYSVTRDSVTRNERPEVKSTILGDFGVSSVHLRLNEEPLSEDATPCSASKSTIPPLKVDDWTKEYEHIDVDWSMQAMDVLYNASFFDYIRDERNLELSSIRLARIIKDYKPKQVATALIWMIQGWTVENTAKLLRSVFSDWLPDLAGCVFALISRGWPKKPQLSLCTAYILLSEPAVSVALFIRTLTESWSKDDTIELISYLDNLLEVLFYNKQWDEDFLKEVMNVYTNSISTDSLDGDEAEDDVNDEDEPESEGDGEDEKVTEQYRRNIAVANYKMALADARLSIAEYRLALLGHWTACENCNTGQHCTQISEIPLPQQLQENDGEMGSGVADIAEMYLGIQV
jgi:hypothetical protein